MKVTPYTGEWQCYSKIKKSLRMQICIFSSISSSKVDRFTSNQHRSDLQPIEHTRISSNTFHQRKRVNFSTFVCFFENRFLLIDQKGRRFQSISLVHSDSTARILSHDCQKCGLSLKFFRYRAPKFLIAILLKIPSTSAANRSCRRLHHFVVDGGLIPIIMRTRYFPYLYIISVQISPK